MNKVRNEKNDRLVRKLIKSILRQGISQPYFERVLELPSGIMYKWNEGKYSAADIALLKIINAYTDILKVAENKFKLLVGGADHVD